ncbi:PA14 domain-containing protein [Persicobacter diffluens]|uniref:PA14 domain-containing protein n=1 Tax=Persicobacter diffluens TaxID=981 RepID=A0AAN5AIN6_9BACT|nr:hypothetical protein PEDI_05790 [Persicobacter diffluens]
MFRIFTLKSHPNLLFLLLLFILPFSVFAEKHIISPANNYVKGPDLGVQPGDTLAIQAGQYPFLGFVEIVGSPEQPVVIINEGGQVKIGELQHYYGINFRDSKHFIFTGTGDANFEYGFWINNQENTGFGISGVSTDYQLDHIEISNTRFAGVQIKCDPICDKPETWGENFTIQNISLHHLFIHDTGGEALYIGHTGTSVNQGACTGLSPAKMQNVTITHNQIERTGWDGIQVVNAISDVNISHNSLKDFSQEQIRNHSSGIFLGENTINSVISNNYVENGYGVSIILFSANDTQVYNNVVINAFQDAIYIANRSSDANRAIRIFNNTLYKPGHHGIITYNYEIGLTSIRNNLIVGPGKLQEYQFAKRIKSYIMVPDHISPTMDTLANERYEYALTASFLDSAAFDLRLNDDSPAIDKGTDLPFPVSTDFEGNSRIYGAMADAGAYENQGGSSRISQPQGLWREVWTDMSNGKISEIPLKEAPTFQEAISEFTIPQDQGNYYGDRISGWLTAPQSGQYTFHASADNKVELWLSTNEQMNNAVRIINLTKKTTYNVFNEQTAQSSEPVSLEAGKKYYIEALRKETGSNDHLTIGWTLPDGEQQFPIGMEFLNPFIPEDHYQGKGWHLELFPTSDFSGTPKVDTSGAIFNHWRKSAPAEGFDPKAFSARWSGAVEVSTEGDYLFTMDANDGSRIFIDGNLIMDAWFNQKRTERTAQINLSAGTHLIQVEYYNSGSWANATLSWQGPDFAKEVIPQYLVSPSEPNNNLRQMPISEKPAPPTFHFPNPSSQHLQWDSTAPDFLLNITDLNGNTVYKTNAPSGQAYIPSGLYIFRYREHGSLQSQKVIVQ